MKKKIIQVQIHPKVINLIFIIFSLILLNCKEKAQNKSHDFKVLVHIEGADDELLSITYLDMDGKKKKIEQQANKGQVVFKGEILHPSWARFYGKKSKANGSFFLEPGEISVKLNSNYPFLKAVKGSTVHDEYIRFRKSRTDLKQASDSLYAMAKPLTMLKDKAQEQETKRQNLYAQIGEIDEIKKLDYIMKHPDSYLSLAFARSLYTYDPKVEDLEYVYGLLGSSMKSKWLGKELYNYKELTKKVTVGRNLPNFTLPDRNGNKVSLEDFKGKYVLVDFWYSGCPPCIAQFPKLKELHQANKEVFEIVGVSHDGERHRNKWLRVLDKFNTTWTQVLDVDNAVCNEFGIQAFPSNFLLDKSGKIIMKNISEHEVENFLNKNIKNK